MTFKTDQLGQGHQHLASRMVRGESRSKPLSKSEGSMPVENIRVFPQTRGIPFEALVVDDLIESIRENGILQPLLVCAIAEGKGFALIAGHRRLRAAVKLGLATVPVFVREDLRFDENDPKALQSFQTFQLVENIQRENLDPLQEAIAIRDYRDRFSLSVRDLSQKLGISK